MFGRVKLSTDEFRQAARQWAEHLETQEVGMKKATLSKKFMAFANKTLRRGGYGRISASLFVPPKSIELEQNASVYLDSSPTNTASRPASSQTPAPSIPASTHRGRSSNIPRSPRRPHSERRSHISTRESADLVAALRASTPDPIGGQTYKNSDVQVRDERDGQLIFLTAEAPLRRIVTQTRMHLLLPELARQYALALHGTNADNANVTDAEGRAPL